MGVRLFFVFFFFTNGMIWVCVLVQGLQLCLWITKWWGSAGRRRKQTDDAAALVQPKALRCSPESSDQLPRGDSVWRKVLRPGWWTVLHVCWTYWKCFILHANVRCWVEQGYTNHRTRWNYTTELCGSESLPVCCSQQEKVSLPSESPCRHFQKTNTRMCVGFLYYL